MTLKMEWDYSTTPPITAPLPQIKLPQTLDYSDLKLNLQMKELKGTEQKV